MTNQPPIGTPPYPSLDQLAPTIPPITWLWPGWIPRGMLTLLCAAPGAGKSYFALDLARRLIHGLPWPDGTPGNEPGAGSGAARNVIYVDAEAAPQLLNARALAWNMDRSHLYPMLGEPNQPLNLTTPACQARLTEMVAALQPALLIVDSLGSAAPGVENRIHVVDALFGYLNRLAARHQCAVLLIHHLRKLAESNRASSSLTGNDVRGSGHIVSLARSVLGLTEVRVLTEVKAPTEDQVPNEFDVPSAAENRVGVQITLDPRPGPTRRLQLLKTNLVANGLGAPVSLKVAFTPATEGYVELSYAPDPRPVRTTQVEACARWLFEFLSMIPGPAMPSQIEPYAYEEGFSRRTLFRARALLGDRVINTIVSNDPYTYWVIPPWPRPAPPAPPEPPSRKGRRPQ